MNENTATETDLAGPLAADYFGVAFELAKHSPDPSTQNGAVIIDTVTGAIIGAGLNDFPHGVEVNEERLTRPLKYSFIEHAERNAIFEMGDRGFADLPNKEMYALWATCTDCARAIIQSGIKRVHTHSFYFDGATSVDGENRKDWGESIDIAFTMLEEAGVDVVFHDCEVMPEDETLLFNSQPVHY